MKSITVQLGKCGTCGTKVYAHVNNLDFLDSQGREQDVIRVEGHCGRPGHASKVAHIGQDEFDAARNGSTI